MHTDAKSLKARGDQLFSEKKPLDTRNQDIARHFYPERADFTGTLSEGDEWMDHLVSGYPIRVRRDLGDSLGSMLRPKGQTWFHLRAEREDNEDHEAKEFLDWARDVQVRAMYDRVTMFSRATKQADHDFAAFGGAIISTEVNRRDQALLYRCWHPRDVAWGEDAVGMIAEVHRNWKPTAAELCRAFPDKVHPDVLKMKEKSPRDRVNVRHVAIRTDEYDGVKLRQPWASIYIDCDHDHVMQEIGSWTPIYTIPRWAMVSGSQYPYSPAVAVALPDARLLQAMTLTLLDAGERAANPPMIGVAEAIRGDLNVFPGGFTSVDAEYDERLGEVLRPLTQDKSGLPFGVEMADRTAQEIREAFYLNTLTLPPHDGPEMTAFEVGQRVQEYIRNALPLFEPMEHEYNGALCEITFETLLREGAFGSPDAIPASLRGSDVKFVFESPLADLTERQKGQKFLEAKAMIAEATAIDPTAPMIMDFGETLRDVLGGIGAPAEWLRSPEDMAAMVEGQKQKQEAAEMLAGMQAGADVAQKLSQASEGFEP